MLSGLNLSIILLIINERGVGQTAPPEINWINTYFCLNALIFFPIAYLILVNYRSKKIHNKEVSNIQKAYEINGESFATSNFIPAYLYHGTVGGSTAAIFLLYYVVFIFAIFIDLVYLLRIIYKSSLNKHS